jgi:hypothetical protein
VLGAEDFGKTDIKKFCSEIFVSTSYVAYDISHADE